MCALTKKLKTNMITIVTFEGAMPMYPNTSGGYFCPVTEEYTTARTAEKTC